MQKRLTGRGLLQLLGVVEHVVWQLLAGKKVANEAHAFEHKHPLTTTQRTVVAE
jgi:hypothetical protein